MQNDIVYCPNLLVKRAEMSAVNEVRRVKRSIPPLLSESSDGGKLIPIFEIPHFF